MKFKNILTGVKNFLTKTSKLKLILMGIGIASVAGTAITLPFAINSKQKYEKNQFKVVTFAGKSFASKQEIIKYMKKNSDEVTKNIGQNIYTVNIGNDKLDFEKYNRAFDHVMKNIKSDIVYIKGNQDLDMVSFEISPSNFIRTEDTIEYVAFPKYTPLNKKGKHRFTFAKKSNSQQVKRAREQAAASYIQFHSAYKFNNIFFYSLADLTQYIKQNWQANKNNFEKYLDNGSFNALILANGNQINAPISDFDDNDFKQRILNEAVPYYKNTPMTFDNIANIAAQVEDNYLDYVKIKSNEDNLTEIVDMDKSTPNGSLYGQYYIRSGSSMDGIDNPGNWQEVSSNKDLQNPKELVDISILKATINYLLINNGFSSVWDMISTTKINNQSLTMEEYIQNNDELGPEFLKDVADLIIKLSKGYRYSHLDGLIALHSYVINKMIQEKKDVDLIMQISKYFDSFAYNLDLMLSAFLAPLFMDAIGNLPANYEIKYFRPQFSFYDDNKPGKGIEFQNNPYSYYRKLTTKDNVDNYYHSIFQLIKGVMGSHAIIMNALKHNQIVFQNWTNQYKQYLESKNLGNLVQLPKINFEGKITKESMWDFSYKSKSQAGLSKNQMQWEGIWQNFNNLPNDLNIKKFYGEGLTQLSNNFENYLLNLQNPIIENYKANVKNRIKLIKDTFEDNVNTNDKNALGLFDYNTIGAIDMPTNDVNDNLASTYSVYHNLNTMVKNAIKPLRERIKNFAEGIGTVAAQAAIAVATAGIGAETAIIEQSIKNTMIKTTTKISFSKKSSYIHKISRSKLYTSRKTWKGSIQKDKSLLNKLKTKVNLDNFSDATKVEKENIKSALVDYVDPLAIYMVDKYSGADFINDVFEVAGRIIKNVVPGISQIINLFDSFSSSSKQIYEFSKLESADTKLYWDGGKVDYSWWGLSSNQIYSIKNLKMLDPIKIISGYGTTNSGFYYNGRIYHDLNQAKFEFAKNFINKMLKSDRNNIKKLPNITWKLELANSSTLESNDLNSNDQNSLFSKAKEAAFSIPKTIYKMSSVLTTGLTKNRIDDAIKSITNKLKPVLVIKLPDGYKNRIPMGTKEFELPGKTFERGGIIKGPKIDKSYVVIDPNIAIGYQKVDEINNIKKYLISGTTNEKDKKAEDIYNQLLKMSQDSFNGSLEGLQKIVNKYLDQIYLPSKTILFEDINNEKNIYYESLDSSIMDRQKTIYYFTNTSGEIKYYFNKAYAIKAMISPENYNIKVSKFGRVTRMYQFNNKVFYSLDQIYNYIIKNQDKGGKNV